MKHFSALLVVLSSLLFSGVVSAEPVWSRVSVKFMCVTPENAGRVIKYVGDNDVRPTQKELESLQCAHISKTALYGFVDINKFQRSVITKKGNFIIAETVLDSGTIVFTSITADEIYEQSSEVPYFLRNEKASTQKRRLL